MAATAGSILLAARAAARTASEIDADRSDGGDGDMAVSARLASARPASARPTGARPMAVGELRHAAASRSARPTGDVTAYVTVQEAALALITRVGEHLGDHRDTDETASFVSFPATVVGADPPGSYGLVHHVSLLPPHDPVWTPPPAGTLLWDAWRSVLDDAEVVDPVPTVAEQEEVDRARNLIFDDVDAAVPSEVYLRYQTLFDEHLDAAAAARAAELDAAEGRDGPDPIVAREAASRAATRLAVEGRSGDVEAALAVISRFGISAPTAMWNEARHELDLIINRGMDAEGTSEYPTTSFVPASFDAASWTSISLDAGELEALAQVAAARLPDLAENSLVGGMLPGPAGGGSGGPAGNGVVRVSAVRAEVARFSVIRPWFRSDILALRAWRFPDGTEPVSDGGLPARGRLPAFVTGLAVLRNLEVDHVEVGTRDVPTGPVHRPPAGTGVRPRDSAANDDGATPTRRRPPATADRMRVPATAARPRETVVRDHRATSAGLRPPATADRVRVPSTAARPRETVRDRRDAPAVRQRAPVVRDHRDAPAVRQRAPAVRDHRDAPAVRQRAPVVRDHREAPAAARGATRQVEVVSEPTTTGAPDARIAAFVCRLVPPAPDPDPDLFNREER